MGFPENILTKDENVVRSLHPHWLTIFKPVLLGLLTVAVVVVIALVTPNEPSWNIGEWAAIGIGIIVVVWVLLVPFLKWRTTHYVITNKRVVVRRGILTKSGQDIALSKITDVSFRQSILDRITKAGSLNIETAGDSEDEDFSSIPRSNEVQQLLNHLIEQDAAAKGGYGGAAHRGHQMMSHRSYDAPSSQPGGGSQQPDAQQPPQFEQGSGGSTNGNWPNEAGASQAGANRGGANQGGWDRGGWDNGPSDDRQAGGWQTGAAPRDNTRPYEAPDGQGSYRDHRGGYPDERGGYPGEQWETPPTR